jgi:hypothetical protein
VVCVVGVIPWSADPAFAQEFHASRPHVVFSDEQQEPIVFGATSLGNVDCRAARFGASLAQRTAKRLVMGIDYVGCSLGGRKVAFATGGCGLWLSPGLPQLQPARIACRRGAPEMRIWIAGLCTLRIGSQVPRGGVAYTDTGTSRGRSFDANIGLDDIAYRRSGGLGCLFAGDGTGGSLDYGIEFHGQVTSAAGKREAAAVWVS